MGRKKLSFTLGDFANGRFCEERAALIIELITVQEAAGRASVVVGIPVSAPLADVYPGGPDSLRKETDRFRTEYLEPAGITFVDLTQEHQAPELWNDYTHLGLSGSTAFTEDIAAALLELGIL